MTKAILPILLLCTAPVAAACCAPSMPARITRVTPLRARLHYPRVRVAATTSAPVSTCTPKEVVAPVTTCAPATTSSAATESQPVLVVPEEVIRVAPVRRTLRAAGNVLDAALPPYRRPILPGGAVIWGAPACQSGQCSPR